MREIIFVRVLVELGDLERAREHLEKARQFVGVAGTDRAKLSLANTQALLEIASNMVDMGLTRIKQTLETTRLKNKGLLPSVLATSVIAYERAGQPDVALTLLHDLLDHKKEMKQAQVLMHHRMHMARVESMRGADEGRDAALRDHHHQLRMQMQDRELVRRNLQLLEEQSVAAELHDDTTGEHCYWVGRLASILGKEIGLEEDICFLIDLTARLHDIGKLVVPDAILLKPGKPTPGEREIMQKHTTAGADILARTSLPQIHIAEAIARHHHERWDGNGYPDRLSGNSIPLAARVTALADVFDALTHKRPYKEAWPIHAALAEIKDLSGKQFDPELCGIFLDLVPRLQREQGDLDYFLAADAKNATFIKARRSMGNDGVIALCIDDSGPALAQLTNELLQSCYGPRFTVSIRTQVETAKGGQREGFDAMVFDALTGTAKSVTLMSGGERVWINECLTRAVALYLSRSAARHYETLFCDETDGALHPERKRMFMAMKREVLRIGGYRREYFISQTPELAAMADAVIDLGSVLD